MGDDQWRTRRGLSWAHLVRARIRSRARSPVPRAHSPRDARYFAVAINPAQRPSMKQLAEILCNLSVQQASSNESEAMIALLRAQSVIVVEYEQRRAATAAFVRALHRDLHESVADLVASSPEFLLWSDWHREATRTPQTADALVQQVAVRESDAPVVNSRFRRIYLNTRFYPPAVGSPVRFTVRIGSELESTRTSSLAVANHKDGVWCEQEIGGGSASSGRYTPSLLKEFLIKATQYVLQAPVA